MNQKHQLGWLLAGIAVCLTAQARPQSPQTPAPAAETAQPGVKVAIDPRTGKLRAPTDEEAQQLSQSAQPAANARALRRGEPLGAGKKGFVAPATAAEATANQRALANGGRMQQVPQSYLTNMAITRNADGQLVMQHVDSDTVPAPHAEADHE